MNGAADLGGMMSFGPVQPEPEGVHFHAEWERRALAPNLAIGATRRGNIDMSRHARESLHPADRLTSSYYAIWVEGLERLLVDSGLVGAAEFVAGRASTPGVPASSSGCTGSTSCPTPMRTARVSSRSGSTRCGSAGASSGATAPTPTSRWPSTPGSATSNVLSSCRSRRR